MNIITNKTFREILAYRGRVMLFTETATVGVKFEQCAERHHATVVCARGWVDNSVWLSRWTRLVAQREYAVLSLSQHAHAVGWRSGCTHAVWVGPIGPDPQIAARFQQAMARGFNTEMDVRHYVITEDQL